MIEGRDLDIVVFGATGFVGRLVAEYLAGHAPREARIGLAGRSKRKLAETRAGLGDRASSWPLLVADSNDAGALAEVAAATRAVATTVGPYRPSGIKLVEACVASGTDYADLAGEVLFIRDSIDRFHDAAARAGVRIVHSSGFDSIPSDLGVMLLHQQAEADGTGDLEETTLVVRALKGGPSGGTLASGKLQIDETRADPALGKVVNDPYALSPDRAEEPDLGDEGDLAWIERDDTLGTWVGPFVMAGINTRNVRRSNALQSWAYGRRFRYREVTDFGGGLAGASKAAATSAGLAAVMAGVGFGPSRALLDRVMPAPGEGPDEKTRKAGLFRIEIHARTSSGARYVTRVEAQGDPGYAATSVMLGESALCLALDRDKLPKRGGVLTPATAMGMTLVDRLRAAGQTLTTRRL
ncbi:MAG TPA: saccharopine dehydrogenase NADP-binding domain-containing protein [Candidatus Dormibacteraeota bacterium]|nr:saccharopine dehydrogenase NADP-binding domain-containing protein [Candidatus Dormibacteraeota bacterium]